MRIEHLRRRLQDLGAKPCHEQRVLRAWLQARALDSGARRHRAVDYFPLGVRTALPAIADDLNALARLRSEHPGADGSARLLVELADGQRVESVLLPRDGVCVSTQVGCAVGCLFCMTGRDGLLRQLGSAEIVAQVVLARTRRVVKKVVFMGMGEPAHNMDHVLEAIEWLGTEGGIGHKSLVFSTVGDRRVFERLPLGTVKPALALSLHTTDAELRAHLLPKAPRFDPAELVEKRQYRRQCVHGDIFVSLDFFAGLLVLFDICGGFFVLERCDHGHRRIKIQDFAVAQTAHHVLLARRQRMVVRCRKTDDVVLHIYITPLVDCFIMYRRAPRPTV